MIAASHSSVNTVMTEHPGQLLHMDTVGPSRVRSMGGKWYVLVIIDDYSRYFWVFFLESKDQVFEHFCLLALRLNNEHPNCLKVIRSDNGTEFRNASFNEFCLEHVIDQQFSTPRVPQQNGVVERKNHTLVEMARMMLDEHRTPRRFWADAISTTCYISNRKPSVSQFRPFGCKCFVLKCENLDKFESRFFDGILLGYTPHGRSYRVYNFETNTVVELCDVTSTRLLLILVVYLNVQVTRKWRRASLYMRDYRASTVMKMNHYFHLYHHPSLFLLLQLKQRLLRLPPPLQQQWRRHGLRGRSSLSRELPLTFRRHIHLNRS
jgi:transposase InsO family protein